MARNRRSEVGALGERLAEAHLAGLGYRIVDRNFRTRSGELDLVVTSGECLVFCEVRTRVGRGASAAAGPGGALDSIGPGKRMRVRRMAREWLAERREAPAEPRAARALPPERLRFDAIGVVLGPNGALRSLAHIEDAF